MEDHQSKEHNEHNREENTAKNLHIDDATPKHEHHKEEKTILLQNNEIVQESPNTTKRHEHPHKYDTEHTEHHKPKKSFIKSIKHVYEHHYKKLLLITIAMVFLSLVQIGFQMYSTSYYVGDEFHLGDFMQKGVSLKGGLSVTLGTEELDITNINIADLEKTLNDKFPKKDVSVREQTEFGIRTAINIEAALDQSEQIEVFKQTLAETITINQRIIDNNTVAIGSTLGESFFKQTFRAMIFAFIFMGIVVFLFFRVPVPSAAVILAALSDIITVLAIVNLMGMKISTAGIAAFLMLIGYSVDTDILLSSRVLRTKTGTVLENIYSAMKTGTLMTFTTSMALIVAIMFSQSSDLTQIMTILLIGLLVDFPYTWIQNAGILRWYLEKKHHN
jgi:preprotein translocase subunit SecF